jgi:exoribonuclease R
MIQGTLRTKDYKTFNLNGLVISGAKNVKGALVGDSVEISTESKTVNRIIKRTHHASIVGTLELASSSRYGFTSRGIPIYLFVPWNEAYPPFYVGSSYADRSTNVVALVDLEDWAVGANCPRGLCRRVIGKCGELSVEMEALIIHTHPVKWKGQLQLMAPIPFSQGGSYLDTRTFHIDPSGCRDIDDAISMWIHDSVVEVRIHIADVASLLASNPILWSSERLGETLYKDGAVVSGLFPTDVESSCSLLPGKQRKTLTLAFVWDMTTCAISNLRWLQQEIIVKESYTYETIVNSEWATLLKTVTSGLAGRDVSDPHEWVSELMLFYNKTAAAVLKRASKGILRRHSEPDQTLLTSLEMEGFAPKFLAFKAGEYVEATDPNTLHWGLQEAVYCHATSPIRRWVDCINQGTLINTLFVPEFVVPPFTIDLVNAQAKRVKAFERDNFFVQMLLSNPMKTVKGNVISNGTKTKVWVPEWNRCVSLIEYIQVGSRLTLSVYANPTHRNWKRRLILEVSSTELDTSTESNF